MMRQCIGCGALLAPGRRSPYCSNCWTEHQRERNRAKSRRFRQRTFAQASQTRPESRALNEEDFEWLDQLDLDLTEPIRGAIALPNTKRNQNDPEFLALLRTALEQYDRVRTQFEERAQQVPDPDGRAEGWRGLFESIREMVR